MSQYLMSVFAQLDPGPYGPYASEEQMKQAFAATDAFNHKLKSEGRFVFANGLAPARSATVVDGQGAAPIFTDGPYLETKEQLGGFWIIEAADLDDALAVAAEGSKACRGRVEVRPIAGAPDMTDAS